MAVSTKPYLGRALWEWCSDNGHTPYLQVKVGKNTRVPQGFVKEGRIVLNIGASATRNLSMGDEGIIFTARFNGHSQEIMVPWEDVEGVFSRETGEGMMFPNHEDEAEMASEEEPASASEPESSPAPRRPTLTVVK
jgi:stringent starvation protein B